MVGEREIRRHFTVTGFVIEDGKVLLHWHPKVEMWLPPGGHTESQLHSNVELLNYKGDLVEIPEDVRKIARYAFEYVDASRVDTDPI